MFLSNRILILFFVCIFSILQISAVSLGVTPSKIDEEILFGEEIVKNIFISAEINQEIRLELSGNVSNFILFSEKDFVISDGEMKKISLAISIPKEYSSGVYSGFLKINALPGSFNSQNSSGEKVSSSLSIPISIKVISEKKNNLFWILSLLVFLLIIYVYYLKNKKERKF